MKTRTIRALLDVVDIEPRLEEDIAKLIAKLIAQLPDDRLTPNEIHIGMHEGKVNVVKAYRDRVGCGLIEAKRFVEKYFSEYGYTFAK